MTFFIITKWVELGREGNFIKLFGVYIILWDFALRNIIMRGSNVVSFWAIKET